MQFVECRRSLWNHGNGLAAEFGDFSGAEILRAFGLFAKNSPLKQAVLPRVVSLVKDIDGLQSYAAVMRFTRQNSRDSAPADIGLFVGVDGISSFVKNSTRYTSDKIYLGNLPADPEVKADTRLISHEDVISWVSRMRDEFVKFLKENRNKWQRTEDEREASVMHHPV